MPCAFRRPNVPSIGFEEELGTRCGADLAAAKLRDRHARQRRESGRIDGVSKLFRTVKEETGRPESTVMIRNLVADQEAVGEAARKVIEAAEAARDQASADVATRRLEIHEKNAWKLRSHLE